MLPTIVAVGLPSLLREEEEEPALPATAVAPRCLREELPLMPSPPFILQSEELPLLPSLPFLILPI